MKSYRSTLIGSCAMMYLYAMTKGVLPIAMVEMTEALQFSLTQGGGIPFAGDLILLIVLFASGFIAAKIGKVNAIIMGGWILTGTLLLCGFSHSYYAILGLTLVSGIGTGVIEALLNPFIHDLTVGDEGKALNIVNAFFSVGACTSVLIFGELLFLGLGWRSLYFTAAGMAAASTLFFTIMRPKGGVYKDKVEPLHLGKIAKSPQSITLGVALFAAGGVEAVLLFWSASYVQLSLGGTVRAAAVGTAIFAGAMAFGRVYSGKVAHKYGLWAIVTTMGVLGLFSALGMFLSQSIWFFYLCVMLGGFAVAPGWPSIQSYAAKRMPNFDATMLMIYLSAWGIPGFALSIFTVGAVGDRFGLQFGFLVVAGLFALLVSAMTFERKLFTPKIHKG